MQVQLMYFASLREALGATETVEVSPGTTVGQLRDQLIALGEPHTTALSREHTVRAALNQTLCPEAAEISDGAEVAFFPPVTGG
ncbi:MAG: molybdopterin converting factor subunit 1 [Leptothrix ochracea]|uniref:molybdopterin converting factor subunit 1 n=1 Tax=Leptothrix ochracea TaxID=735331 RepID=UPI0034E2F555